MAKMILNNKIVIMAPSAQLERRHHYENLDILRGIAAICVVLYHFSSRVNYAGLMYHGYLAVDFFFCLSGFVISHAYYGKLRDGTIGTPEFIIVRLIRFMPLVLFGNVIAAFTDIFRPGQYSVIHHLHDIFKVFVTSTLLLPTLHETTLEATTYPLNGPVWSLFFELFANIIFIFVAKSMYAKYIMGILCAISLVLLTNMSLVTGNIHFGPHIEFFLYAFPRVIFSFFAGALLTHVKRPGFSMSWLTSGIVLIAVFSMQKIDSNILSAAYDLFSICFIFTLIVLAGANHFGSSEKRVPMIFGNASYPLYCIHYPIVRGLSVIMRRYYLPDGVNIALSFVFTALLFAISILAFNLYDLPVRNKINNAFKSIK